MVKPNYLTIGELAHKVGVTVRTIQYYDQEGLLSPSAKGPQNQRLYTEENVKDLYRILSLKYLGLSLAQIKSEAGLFANNGGLFGLVNSQIEEIEDEFQHLFKRLTTLRGLMEKSRGHEEGVVAWEGIAQAIEEHQDESQFFWRLVCVRDDEQGVLLADETVERGDMVSKWHELIADTIRLISDEEPANSARSYDLAKRYLSLDESQEALSVNQNFILMENIMPTRHGDGSFDALRKTVQEHLELIVSEYKRANTT